MLMAIDGEALAGLPALDGANVAPEELDNLNASVLDAKLKYVRNWIEHRRKIANSYRIRLAEIADVRLPHFDESKQRDVFQNYVIRAVERDQLKRHLETSGIETLIHWPHPIWGHAGLNLPDPRLPKTEALCREVLSLPMSAETTEEHVEIVCDAIRRFYRSARVRAARA